MTLPAKLLTLSFLLAWSLAAQTITSTLVQCDAEWCRFTSEMDSNPVTPTLSHGPTAAYGTDLVMDKDNSQTRFTQSKLVMGLADEATVHWRICTSGAGTGTCVNGTADTTAKPAVYPAYPEAPNLYSPGRPIINGGTSGCFVSGVCSVSTQAAFNAALADAAALTDSLNYEIVIAAPLDIVQHTEIPARPSHTGWVIVRSAEWGTAKFPPAGVKPTGMLGEVTFPITDIMPTFKNVSWGAWTRYIPASLPADCGLTGRLASVNVGGGTSAFLDFPVMLCDQSTPAYSGPATVSGWSGTGPVTVTITGHSIALGNPVTFPSNDCVGAGTWLAHNIQPNSFDIDVATSGACTDTPTVTVKTQWTNPPHTRGSGDPSGPCTEEHWYQDTTESWQDIFWCAGGGWTRRQEVPSEQSAGNGEILEVQLNAKRWWFEGLNFQVQATPNEPNGHPFGWDVAAVLSNQGLVRHVVLMEGTSEIVFDQCRFDGRGYPTRVTNAFVLRGDGDYAIADSSFTNISWWTWDQVQANGSAVTINWISGARLRLENLYLHGSGINLFSTSETNYTLEFPPSDLVARRLVISKEGFRDTTPGPSLMYATRHHVEFKNCKRCLVDGVALLHGYANTNFGAVGTAFHQNSPPNLPAAFTISGFTDGAITTATSACMRVGDAVVLDGTGSGNHDDKLFQVTTVASCTEFTVADSLGVEPTGSGATGSVWLRAQAALVDDIYFANLLAWRATEIFRIDGDQGGQNEPLPMRVQGDNILAVDGNFRAFASGGWVDADHGSSGGNNGVITSRVASHIDSWRHSGLTAFRLRGWSPALLTGDEPMAGMSYESGIVVHDETTSNNIVRFESAAHLGEAGLNWAYPNGWSSDTVTVCCGKPATGQPPAWDFTPADENAIGWMRPALENPLTDASVNFRLRHDSPYISGGNLRGADGRDRGADIDRLEQALGIIRQQRVRSITANSAIASALVPDPAATCTIEVHEPGLWGSGTRFTGTANDDPGDGAQDRSLNVPLTGLTPGNYEAAFMCAGAINTPAAPFTIQ